MIATIYGTGLAYTTGALAPTDLHGGYLPTVLPGTGVHVLVGGLAAGIYYVSPGQINFLVPVILIPGPSTLVVTLDGLAGPILKIQIAATSPGLFQSDPQTIIATRPDGSLVTSAQPAGPGDYLILYATGLGPVVPPVGNLEIPTLAARLTQISDLPGHGRRRRSGPLQHFLCRRLAWFSGLYQINLQMPASLPANTEIRVGIADQLAQPG